MRKTYKVLLLLLLASVLFFLPVLQSVGFAEAYGNLDSVYLGGTPIGLVAASDHLIITETRLIITREGTKKAEGTELIQPGDLLISINGYQVDSTEDVGRIVNSCKEDNVRLVIRRDGVESEVMVRPLVDILENKKKLGIIVKNEIAGIGTLTYVRADNKRFGGLGHPIFDEFSKGKSYYNKGYLYDARIVGIVKGEAGKAGELRGTFRRMDPICGTLEKNIFSGVFGISEDALFDKRPLIALGSRDTVRQGAAYIYTTIDGTEPQKFEIEIVKAVHQNIAEDKSMVIHVTDPVLLEKTGGICQGMSGSPIVQNGRLIGAVTHVFINDPTRGYGIYVDWMLPN
jgi:stage IV sporulation protein B